MTPPRVRFAPAPTGWLHVGGARTALYNWLHARRHGGAFVLRVEDTDVDRSSEASFQGILEALRFLGLDWDEGPDRSGPHGPYRQSERRSLYTAVAAALLEAGHVYDAYETPEELEADRRAAQAAGRPPGYSGAHRDLDDRRRQTFIAAGRKPVLRVRTPDDGEVIIRDVVRGDVAFAWRDIPDFVVLRADGTPTYFLANAVDDLAMGINHIARGEDLLPATPRQLLVYQHLLGDGLLDKALADNGYPPRPPAADVPSFAHLPLLVGADRKPLSKRHHSVAVDEYRREGYLPEALVNFLALLGWSYDATTERFEVDELVERFSFDRVGRNPAYFDTKKLRAMNGDRIKALSDETLAERLVPVFVTAGLVTDPPDDSQQALLLRFAPLLRERIQVLSEAVPLLAFAFAEQVRYDEQAVAKHLKGRAGEVLERAAQLLESLQPWTDEAILAALDRLAEELDLGRGKVMMPLRVAMAGTAVSPPLPETLARLDRDLVLERIEAGRRLVRG